MALIKSFEELDCWKVLRELTLELSKLDKDFSKRGEVFIGESDQEGVPISNK